MLCQCYKVYGIWKCKKYFADTHFVIEGYPGYNSLACTYVMCKEIFLMETSSLINWWIRYLDNQMSLLKKDVR